MHAGQLDSRHVTRRAFFRADRTCCGATALSLCFFRFRQVTRETLRIVIRRIFLQMFVRIVTRETPDSRIVRVVTTTIEHAIRLKTDVVNS